MTIRLNQILKWTGLLILSAVCISCSTLKSPHIAGEHEPVSEKDLADITIWENGDDVFFVARVDSNTLVAATLEWNDKINDFAVRSFPIIRSNLGDHMFLNVREGELYSIFRMAVACDDDEPIFALFTIDPAKIEKDIADGKIKARKQRDDIVMECTKEEQDAYILENINTIFHMDGIGIVRQIAVQKD